MKMPAPGQPSEIVDRTRALTMARSKHAYRLANTLHFYELADNQGATRICAGPPGRICNCNLRASARNLNRLYLSLETTERGSGLPGSTTAKVFAARLLAWSVARKLAPRHLRLEIAHFICGQAMKMARDLSFVIGTARALDMDAAMCRAWRLAIESPAWRWDSTAALIRPHEIGYLEGCQRHAPSPGDAL